MFAVVQSYYPQAAMCVAEVILRSFILTDDARSRTVMAYSSSNMRSKQDITL